LITRFPAQTILNEMSNETATIKVLKIFFFIIFPPI
jgi:hypothetical protein